MYIGGMTNAADRQIRAINWLSNQLVEEEELNSSVFRVKDFHTGIHPARSEFERILRHPWPRFLALISTGQEPNIFQTDDLEELTEFINTWYSFDWEDELGGTSEIECIDLDSNAEFRIRPPDTPSDALVKARNNQ